MKRYYWVFVMLLSLLPTFGLAQNPATIPAEATPRIWADRWKKKLERVKKGKIDLIFVGDSISHAWDNAEHSSIWSAYYGARNAVSLGYSGARTENILWMLNNGIVDGISPKVAIVMIGTNNSDGVHFPTAHTPEQIAEGIQRIVQTLRQKLPRTKILLLRVFPRDNLPGTRAAVDKLGELTAPFADNKAVFYLDINQTFLNPDGSINKELMPDLLHPNAVGNLRWAQAMEATLQKLMGKPVNNAIIPTEKVEDDFYDWYERHEAVKAYIKNKKIDLVFVGDSITHMFGGQPTSNRILAGDLWEKWFGKRNALNLGFGWDRTQQVLWRLQNGEFEGLHPKVAVVLIGTNNIAPHAARGNTNEETVAGITAVCNLIHKKSPKTQILLLGLLPRDEKPGTVFRVRIQEINKELAKLDGKKNITFLDMGSKVLDENGVIRQGLTTDFLHLSEGGYALWAETIDPILKKMLGE